MMYQDNKICDDDEDIIDKRRKNAHCWLFIDEELLIHDTCVGEDAVRELGEEAEMKRLIQIDAEKKKVRVFNKNKVLEYHIRTVPTIFS
jgi:hypothetical protein